MRRIRFLTLTVLLLLSVPVLGQPPLNFNSSFTDSLVLLRLEEVQTDLKMTLEQASKVKEGLLSLAAKYEKEAKALHKTRPDEEHKPLAKLRDDTAKEGMKLVEKAFQPDQARRFQQICIQQRGYQAFLDPDIQKTLKLSDDQLKQIPAVLAEREKKESSLRVIRFQDIEQINEETRHAMIGLLSSDQRKVWQDLTGKELKINRIGILTRLK